jgi:hypothetical protein
MITTIRTHRGVAMFYAIIMMAVMCMILSLAVDYGHAQLVKTELRRTADASARAAIGSLSSGLVAASKSAKDVAKLNTIDGQPCILDSTKDIEYGIWDVNTKKFTPSSDTSKINAVHVMLKQRVNMMLASVMGRNFCDVQAETIMMQVPAINVNQRVEGTANPFLAGMKAGSRASETNPHNNPDYAGDASNWKQSPLAMTGIPIGPNTSLTFDNIAGTMRHDPNLTDYQPDGDLQDIGHNNLTTNPGNNYVSGLYSENGIHDMRAPINALVGVFLTDDEPNKTSVPDIKPEQWDYTKADARNKLNYSPALKQIFFIGDGKTDDGATQTFTAPEGATRLYLASWDFYEWNNNSGYRIVKITRPGMVAVVK